MNIAELPEEILMEISSFLIIPTHRRVCRSFNSADVRVEKGRHNTSYTFREYVYGLKTDRDTLIFLHRYRSMTLPLTDEEGLQVVKVLSRHNLYSIVDDLRRNFIIGDIFNRMADSSIYFYRTISYLRSLKILRKTKSITHIKKNFTIHRDVRLRLKY